MGLNPHFKISIQIEDGDEQWLDVMKQEFKRRLIKGRSDYFAISEEEERQLTVFFMPRNYTTQKQFIDSFEKNVMEPFRRMSGLE